MIAHFVRFRRLVLALVLIGAAFALGWHGIYAPANRWMQDFFAASKNRTVSDDIVIVAIDDESLSQIGRWPWSRAVHAALLERIAAQQPRAIGMDLIFTERASAEEDRLLAAAMAQCRGLVLPVLLLPSKSGEKSVALPVSAFVQAADSLAHVHVDVDPDGMVRTVPAIVSDGQYHWRHLSLVMANAEKTDMGTENAVRIPFAGPAGMFPRYSYADVLRDKLPQDALKDKWVLIGVVSAGSGDTYVTPATGRAVLMPGVEILAHLLDAKLQNIELVPAAAWLNATFCASILALALVGFFSGGGLTFWAMLGLSLGVMGLGWGAAKWGGILLSPAAALMILWAYYLSWSALRMREVASFFFKEVGRIQVSSSRFSQEAVTQKWSWLNGDAIDRGMLSMTTATRQLSQMHAFVENTLDGLPEPLLVTDQQGVIKLANVRAISAFCPHGANPVGSSVYSLLANLMPIDEMQCSVSQLLSSKSKHPFSEMVDDQDRHWMVRGEPIFVDPKIPGGWIVNLSDVSALRQAESAREEAMQFVSHDIRSPQSSIIALIDSHRLDGGGDLPERVIEKIEQYALSSLDISNSFVQLSRAKAVEFHISEVEIGRLLEVCIDEVWPRAQMCGVEIVHDDLDAEPRIVLGDALLLRRAIVNLLTNAVKYSPRDGRVTVRSASLDHCCRIEIQDQGPGVATEDEAQLFQSFSTLKQSHNAQASAIGLGLRMVRVVAERHRGRAGISKNPNMTGACFFIELPMDDSSDVTLMGGL